jgi:hypothetical protein
MTILRIDIRSDEKSPGRKARRFMPSFLANQMLAYWGGLLVATVSRFPVTACFGHSPSGATVRNI